MKTPSTLSVALSDGMLRVLVRKDSTVPIEKKGMVSTLEDNETSVTIQVVYGDNMFIGDNIKIAEYIVDNIPPKPKWVPKVEISFSIDTDLILRVKTTVLDNGHTREFEGIALSDIKPPNRIIPTPASYMEDLFGAFGMRQPVSKGDDFAKIVHRLGSDPQFQQLFFGSREPAISSYNLDQEQVTALELITPEIMNAVGRRALLERLQTFVNFIKSNPNATRCAFCNGLGLQVSYERTASGISWSSAKCQPCDGVGFVQ